MKKIFSLFVAAITAMTISATELTLDLSTAQQYASEGCTSTPTIEEGVLNVAWAVPVEWQVSGVKFALPDITNVSKINFDLKGDGQNVVLYVYLVDANGGLKWENEHWITLESTEWAAIEVIPNADLWGNHGEEPWKELVVVANPASGSGVFSIRDLKITCDYEGGEAAKPETAPAAPTHDEENVMALYGTPYAENNLHFNVLGWGDVKTWETLKLGEDSTNVLYCQDMKWEMMTNWDKDSYDFSEFEKFHFDVWVPGARHLKVTFEAQSGWKHGIDFKLNEGWNTIDADPAWWISEEAPYDWKDVKYIAFEGYKYVDSEVLDSCTSAEGTPFAFANLYWWKSPAVDYPDAPALPTIAEEGVMALFCPAYTTNNVNFAPQSWGGAAWENVDGKFFYTGAMTWDGFTNWDVDHYDMYDYDTFVCDIYVTVDSKLKITFEALGAGDGGTGWKNGAVVEGLKANEWNHVEIDLLNSPFDTYEFRDVRYLILEGFTKAEGGSAEGTPLGIANAMFAQSAYLSVENVNTDVTTTKRIENGRLIIERNGVKYNAQGAVEK